MDHPLLRLLAELLQALDARFGECQQAGTQHLALRRLQLALELLCKLEEQLLHPALGASRAEPWPALARAMHEVNALRDQSAALGQTDAAHREAAVAALRALAHQHFTALSAMLGEADASALPWAALERETQELLARWRAEVEESGEIEDEDGDPVGQPPR